MPSINAGVRVKWTDVVHTAALLLTIMCAFIRTFKLLCVFFHAPVNGISTVDGWRSSTEMLCGKRWTGKINLTLLDGFNVDERLKCYAWEFFAFLLFRDKTDEKAAYVELSSFTVLFFSQTSGVVASMICLSAFRCWLTVCVCDRLFTHTLLSCWRHI